MIKRLVKKLIDTMGFKLERKDTRDPYSSLATDLTSEEISLIKSISESKYTLVSIQRLVATLLACKYVVKNNIPGDFVECGVWRGGNSILAKKTFESLGSDKKVYMFDTFKGMTEPTELDISIQTGANAKQKYQDNLNESHNEWCYASLQDVQNNVVASGIDLDSMKFIQGDVLKTLNVKTNLPNEISVLRLDTDWYESTKKELEVLYPLLETKGVSYRRLWALGWFAESCR